LDIAEELSIYQIEISDETAKVQVSIYLGPLSAVDYEYNFVRKCGGWEFVRVRFRGMS
jgi:hypothetical protein